MSAYADSLDEMSIRLTALADDREDQAMASGLPLMRRRDITPDQIADALAPWSARIGLLRRSAATAARSAKELR